MNKQELKRMCKMAKTYQHPYAPEDNMKAWAKNIKHAVSKGENVVIQGCLIEVFVASITQILIHHAGLASDCYTEELKGKVGKALGWIK